MDLQGCVYGKHSGIHTTFFRENVHWDSSKNNVMYDFQKFFPAKIPFLINTS